ncbi:hypothetical protein [Achromobacter insolitus]|uniref:hypothetical protein n=1 Tax=Achromobacter insolitus TaxID=217204 RepID=UPI0027E1D627|nr:hypothetical protein [Achromobacter insolitus]MDQ6212337.1 hypothetical protein [Achromobacter insolitus]
MHTLITQPYAARQDDQTRTADHGHFPREACVQRPKLNDADVLSVLFDLFAGRTTEAFGESLDWWSETLQSDLTPKAAAGVALSAMSKWQFDQRAGAAGVAELRAQLLQRARLLIDRAVRDTGEVVL